MLINTVVEESSQTFKPTCLLLLTQGHILQKWDGICSRLNLVQLLSHALYEPQPPTSWNRPFSSYILPLCQNESKTKPFK